jgi:hypothetical protein
MRWTAFLFALLISAPTLAGPMDLEKFQKKAKKFASQTSQEARTKPRSLCVCRESGHENHLGAMLQLVEDSWWRTRMARTGSPWSAESWSTTRRRASTPTNTPATTTSS